MSLTHKEEKGDHYISSIGGAGFDTVSLGDRVVWPYTGKAYTVEHIHPLEGGGYTVELSGGALVKHWEVSHVER